MKQEDFKIQNIRTNLEDFSFITKFYPTIFNTENIETKPQDKKMKSYSSFLEYEKEIVNNTNDLSKVLKFISKNKILLATEFSKLLNLEENKKIKNTIDKNKLLKIGVYKLFPQFPHDKKLIKISKEYRFRVARFKEQKLPDQELLEHLTHLSRENNIPAPTQEQINKIETIDNIKNQQIENDIIIAKTNYYLSSILEKNRATSEKEKIEKMEFIKTLYSSESLEKNLRQESEKHYKNISQYLEEVKNNQKDFFDFIRKELGITNNIVLLPTSNQLFNVTNKKQTGVLKELDKKDQDARALLKQKILEDTSLTQEQKNDYIEKTNESSTNALFELDRYLGSKLDPEVNIVLRAIRAIVFNAVQSKEVGSHHHPIKFLLKKLYKLCGLTPHNNGGYHPNQTKKIISILTSSLTERILVKDEFNNVIKSTSFLLEVTFHKIKTTVKKDKEGKELLDSIIQEQCNNITIKVSDFLFANHINQLDKSYLQDVEGYIRFRKRNKTAIGNDLFLWFEIYLSAKDKTKELNLATIIELLRVVKRYKQSPKEIKNKIENAFKDMIEENTLIKDYKLVTGAVGQEKYIFTNARYSEKPKLELLKTENKNLTKSKNKGRKK